jgi:hypothetical protein
MLNSKTALAIAAICFGGILFAGILFRANWIANSRAENDKKLPSDRTLRQIAAFDLPGPVGKRFDYLTIDTDDHYLLSAHLGAGILYVIDLKDNRLVKAIPDVPVRPRATEGLYVGLA